jgi:hypothetical protein
VPAGILFCVHPRETVDRVLRLCVAGRTTREVARLASLPESTVAHWRRGDRRSGSGNTGQSNRSCPRCSGGGLHPTYAYLLGTYLGDGYITVGPRGVQALSIFCANAWPDVRAEVEAAVHAALGTRVCRIQRAGCVEVKSYSKHWTCLFPQHGPGGKHSRPIRLEPWQREVVEQHTGRFLGGLIHSDGCRMTNWVRRPVSGAPKRYEYPRYFFTNKSGDILDLCAAALERLGIPHTRPRSDTISLARRAAVAALDEHVGPKS